MAVLEVLAVRESLAKKSLVELHPGQVVVPGLRGKTQ